MNNESAKTLRAEVLAEVEGNILRYWLDHTVDEEHGGFYGRIKGDGTLVADANKGGILNARILWSFSAAYRVLGKEEYLRAAQRAKDYILKHFFDYRCGGTYWELDCNGKPVDTKKQFYALGFMLYGLSEYARATGDKEAFGMAMALYHCIEGHGLDRVNNGYIEACTCEWGEIGDFRLSELDANYPKSQNTHLHIIEPYTNLYRCIVERGISVGATLETQIRVKNSLRNLVNIFTQHILNPETHHLDLFFDMDWTRGAGWLESYGHDIECAWLLRESVLVLASDDLPKTRDDEALTAKTCDLIAQVVEASRKGLNADGSMTHEANLDTGHVDTDRHWWVQAETVVGFFDAWQHTGKDEYLTIALNCWNYIKQHIIDHEQGEWVWSCSENGEVNRKDDHAGFWKCPYHNTRMCLEIIERTE